MFCKVCKDAGKSEKEYSSHYVKDSAGKPICPTLLNQSCRYCGENGHTVKFCPTLAANKKTKLKIDKIKRYDEEKEEQNQR